LLKYFNIVEDMLEFLKQIILFLQNNNIDYMLSVSVALSAYTLPRATRDFDFIIRIKNEDAKFSPDNFKEGYYCDKEAIEDAIKNHSMFNIIDYASGFKADFIVLKNENFRQTEFERRKEIELFNMKMFIVNVEDLSFQNLRGFKIFKATCK
jgi:hypothetical protein